MFTHVNAGGLYFGKYPGGEGGISANVFRGKKYEKAKRKKGKNVKENGRKKKNKERGMKMSKGEVRKRVK